MGGAEIVFDRVTKRYAGRAEPALRDLSLEIPAGAFCVLVGPSGCGKTTALKLVNRLVPLDDGEETSASTASAWANCPRSRCGEGSATSSSRSGSSRT